MEAVTREQVRASFEKDKKEYRYSGKKQLDANISWIFDAGMEFGKGAGRFGMREVLGCIIHLEAMEFILINSRAALFQS